VTGIVELTLALALKSLKDAPSADYTSAAIGAHTSLLLAIEKGQAAAAQEAVETIIGLDDQQARTLL